MQLSTNHIIVSDLDTPMKELLVWLVSPPKHGFIENTNRGEIFVSFTAVDLHMVAEMWLELGQNTKGRHTPYMYEYISGVFVLAHT